MNDARLLGANRALRTAAVPLALGGAALHLWLGSRPPLLAVAVGVLCHLAAGLLGRRVLRRRLTAGNRGSTVPVGGTEARTEARTARAEAPTEAPTEAWTARAEAPTEGGRRESRERLG